MRSATQTRTVVDGRANEASQEQGLIDYMRLLGRWMTTIAAVAVVCGIATFLIASSMTKRYEASVTVMVSPSKMGEGPDLPVAISSFRALMENRTIARAVIDEFSLGQRPYLLTPASFVDDNLTVDEIRGTNFLRARVRLPDAGLAARVANRLVERGVELNNRLNQREDLATTDFMKGELDETGLRLQQLRDRLLDYKRTAQVELTQEDTRSLLDQRGRLLQLVVDIEGERARLAKAEEELAKQPPTLSAARSTDLENALAAVARQDAAAARNEELRRGVAPRSSDRESPAAPGALAPSPRSNALRSDGARQDGARQDGARTNAPRIEPRTGEREDSFLGVEFGSGVANPVHEILQYQVTSSRARLSALERQRDELTKTRGVGGKEIAKLVELHQKETEIEKRQMEYELASRIYSDISTRYEQARIRVASKSAQLSILDPAVPPDRPFSPRPLLSAIEAAVIGCLVAAAAALAYELLAVRS